MVRPRIFRFWDCGVRDCPRAAVIDVGGCARCKRHFCAKHLKSPSHTCSDEPLDDEAWEAALVCELESLRAAIKDEELLRIASKCNHDRKCWIDITDPLGRSCMGGMNVHLELCFEDGKTWLARILRHNYTSFSDEFTNEILLSEFATLKWLEGLKLPTPQAYAYGLRNDPSNKVGVAYMMIDKLPGEPLMSLEPSVEQQEKVYGGLAEVLYTLSKHPFDQIGSLTISDTQQIQVGPIASDRTGTLPIIGPFSSQREYYKAWAEQYMCLIADGQLFTKTPAEAYAIFAFCKSVAESNQLETLLSPLYNQYFLKHMDDKGDHILVDKDYNITGLIDWTFARTVPAIEAFGPSLVTADMNSIYSGQPGLSDQDRILASALDSRDQELGKFARGPDKARRFVFSLGMGIDMSFEECIDLLKGILRTLELDIDGFDWDTWYNRQCRALVGDTRFDGLLKSTQGYPSARSNRKSGLLDVPRWATCSFTDCRRPNVRGSSCSKCLQHFCTLHKIRDYHKCPSSSELDDEAWEAAVNKEVEELLSQINFGELARHATVLNNEKLCSFRRGKHLGEGATMGCANYHGIIHFDDGEEWFVRIPRTGFSDVPPDLVEYLVTSEYATLKFLEQTKIPAPKAFGFALASAPDNHVGVSYIFMQVLPGKPYDQYGATPEQARRVLDQVADILVEISKHPLPKIGSLLLENDQIKVGPVASNRWIKLDRYGPFDNAHEYLTSIAEQYMDLIADGQVYDDYPEEAFLFYGLLRAEAHRLSALGESSVAYLKHVDDKGDHILVDEDFNVTGIIDWQFARAVPAAEAFGPSLLTADLSDLYSGNAKITDGDSTLSDALRTKGEDVLADLMLSGDMIRRFHLGLASGFYLEEARELIQGVLSCLEVPCKDGLIDEWMRDKKIEFSKDPRWRKIESLVASQKDKS